MLSGATTDEPGGGGGFREQHEHRLWNGETPKKKQEIYILFTLD